MTATSAWAHLSRHRCLLFTGLAAALCYVNTLGNGFVWQDRLFILGGMGIVDAPMQAPLVFVRGLYALKGGVDQEIYYRPLMILSFSLDHAIWALNAAGYHLTNLLWHLVNSLLAFVLFDRYLRRPAALAGALLFAVHPIHAASVAYVTNRLDVICLGFLLAAFLLFTDPPRATPAPAGLRRTAGGGLCFALALFAKETAIVLPILLALHGIASTRGGLKTTARRLAPALTVTVALGVAYLVLRRAVVGPLGLAAPPVSPPSALFWTMLNVLRSYVGILLWPARLTTSDAVPIAHTALDHGAWLSALLAVALAGGGILLPRRAPAAGLGILWFLVTLLPVSNLIPIIYARSEHFLYIPSLGFALAAAAAAETVGHAAAHPLARRATVAAVAVAIACCGLRTAVRNRDWGDEVTLFGKSVAITPYGREAHACLGFALADAGRHDAAIAAFERALVADARYASFLRPGRIWRGIGQSRFALGAFDAAHAAYTASLTHEPDNVHAVTGQGNAALALGRVAEAADRFHRALALAPDFAPAWHNLGAARLRGGDPAGAVHAYTRATQLRPDDASAHFYLGQALEAAGDPSAAREAYVRARVLMPAAPEIAAALARLPTSP